MLNSGQLYRYTRKEISNIQSKNIKIAKSNKDIIKFVRTSKYIPSNIKPYISKVSDNVANKIKEQTGINIKGYNISITSSFINHTLKRHGDYNKEISRGQNPIVEKDFINICKIINEPDKIIYEGLNKDNKPVLQIEKNINGKNIVVTYVSDKHHNLELQTMYKYKNKRFFH